MIDFLINGGGTVYIVTPQTPEAREWLDDNVVHAETIWFAGGIAVEHRYIEELAAGILEAGFTVELNGEELVAA